MTSLMLSSTTDGRDELAEGTSATPFAGTAFSSSAMASACCEIGRFSENWGRARLTGRKGPSESALSHFPRSLVAGRLSRESRIRRQKERWRASEATGGTRGEEARRSANSRAKAGLAVRLKRSGRVEKGERDQITKRRQG